MLIRTIKLFYLTVWDLNGGSFTPIKEVDFLRESTNYYNYLYSENDFSKIVLTHTGGNDKQELFPLTSPSPHAFVIGSVLSPSNDNEYVVNQGFYLARFEVTQDTSATLTYRSDEYTCPFHDSYTDSRKIFEPCTGSTDNAPSIDTTPILATNNLFVSPPYLKSFPRFDLGTLAKKQVLNIRLDFPDTQAGTAPDAFQLNILDTSGNPISPKPPPFGADISVASTYQTFWTVPADGDYILEVKATAAIATIKLFYLTVWDPNGGSFTPIKEVDFLRETTKFYKYIHAQNDDS